MSQGANVITAHAKQRAVERLGFLSPDEVRKILETIERQRPGRKVPLWADPRQRHGLKLDGIVLTRVWQPWERRTGWQRQRLVGFPAILRDGRYTLTTCILGPFTGSERARPEGFLRPVGRARQGFE